MDFVPTPKQALLLLRLLFTREEPKQSEAQPELAPKERQALVDAGFIKIEKRGRAGHLVLVEENEENSWRWALAHLDESLPKRSTAGDVVFQKLREQLKKYLTQRNIALGELFVEHSADTENGSPSNSTPIDLTALIRAAYLEESGGKLEQRVRLSRLRQRLGAVPRTELDETLIELQNKGILGLHPLDDPRECRPEDEDAAVNVFGARRHIMYLRR